MNEQAISFLPELVSAFYPEIDELGEFEQVPPAALPEPYRSLLDHSYHMTVTLEQYFSEPVKLEVLRANDQQDEYWRKIVLRRESDGRIVLFGLVRLDLTQLPSEAVREIRQQVTPLGHILIRHNVLREVERLRLWRIHPGLELQRLFGSTNADPLYGRTAIIHCNGDPAIELLEIVAAD